MPDNTNARIEAFSDGVFAIAITLLILDIKVPPIEAVRSQHDLLLAVVHLWPSVFALSLSFTIILISWVGHHNLLKGLDKTSNQYLFANGFFLFTIIVMPFPTAFIAEYLNTPYAKLAVVIFCLNGILGNVGWNVLYRYVLHPVPLVDGSEKVKELREAAKRARYGLLIYPALVLIALWLPYVALTMSILVWLYWLYTAVNASGAIKS